MTHSSGPDSYQFVSLSGADAAAFLHGQLTVDIQSMISGDVRRTAWCDASGRVLAIVHLVRDADRFILKLPGDLAEGLLKRLRMFILRASVVVQPLPDWRHACWPMATRPDVAALGSSDIVSFRWHEASHAEIWGPEASVNRWMAANAVSAEPESALRINAGHPWVTGPVSGLYQPQMLNLHWLGGVDFRKGCYPGQEVVARLQYRGKLKRRLYRVNSAANVDLQAGDLIEADGKPVGRILEAARNEADDRLFATAVLGTTVDSPLSCRHAELNKAQLPYPTAA